MYANTFLYWIWSWQPVADWLTAVGTVGLAVVAFLSIEEIRGWFLKPHIRPKELKLVRTEQTKNGEKFIYHRLIVTNVKRISWLPGKVAKGVRVFLTYDNNGQPPPCGMIPIPVRWTYWNGSKRDISRREPAYLDVFEEKTDSDGKAYYEFLWPDGMAGSRSAEGFLKRFNPEHGNPRLEFYEGSGGKIGDMTMKHFPNECCFKFKVVC